MPKLQHCILPKNLQFIIPLTTFQPGDKIDYTITLTNPTNAVYKDYVVYDELLKNNLIASKDVTEPTVTGYDLFTENTAKVTVEPSKPITIKYTLTIPDLTTLPEGTTLPATISNIVADQKVDIVVDKPKVNVLKTALSGGVSVSGKTFQPGDKIDYT
ncbi:DUF11 domain-containing protein, partial [Cetobacterium somerae]|nr:DUF11 domain-containing protein [Cetobacterium somerae]